MSDFGETIRTFIFMAVIFFCGIMFGFTANEKIHQRKAVEAGVALWIIDPKTGSRDFVYGKE